jgi:hypothetical protein
MIGAGGADRKCREDKGESIGELGSICPQTSETSQKRLHDESASATLFAAGQLLETLFDVLGKPGPFVKHHYSGPQNSDTKQGRD